VDGTQRLLLQEAVLVQRLPWGEVQKKLFDPIQTAILDLMSSSSLPNFLTSKEYRKYASGSLKAAIERSIKPKVVIFRSRSQSMDMIERYFDFLDNAERSCAATRLPLFQNPSLDTAEKIQTPGCTNNKFLTHKPLPPKPPAPPPPPKPRKISCPLITK